MKNYDEHTALDQYYTLERFSKDGEKTVEDLALRRAMNEVLRDAYVEDCRKVVRTWNKILSKEGCDQVLTLPHRRFYRQQGIYAGMCFDTDGKFMNESEWQARRNEWLPNGDDKSYVQSLMVPVTEPGKFADWIAPPPRGIDGQPIDFEYIEFNRQR
jgi:benzoyl-CoA 2,3-dioxygenase component B